MLVLGVERLIFIVLIIVFVIIEFSINELIICSGFLIVIGIVFLVIFVSFNS